MIGKLEQLIAEFQKLKENKEMMKKATMKMMMEIKLMGVRLGFFWKMINMWKRKEEFYGGVENYCV